MHSWPTPSVPAVAGNPVPLKLYDTADQQVKAVDTTPDSKGEVGLYVCGITPYDSTHLGHAATYLTFDLVQRQLLANGHKVHYVQNITDEEYLIDAGNTGSQFGIPTYVPGNPRLYGMRVGYTF